jgi:predicted Zn-dependent peptidase
LDYASTVTIKRPSVRSCLVRETTLDNGIRVVTESVAGVRSVSIGVLVGAGPRDESLAQAGLAHLCEHLMFHGTSSRTATQIARFMDSAGGGMGAFTSHDYTCYTATVLDDYCPYALELLGDILLNSTFPEASLRREQSAVVCEIDGDLDSPPSRTRGMMREIAWPAHALGRSVTGSADSVRGLTREDAIYFIHGQYLPSRVIIAAAGCLDHDDFVAEVRDGFWRMGGQRSGGLPERPRAASGRRTIAAPVSLAYFSLGLQAPPYADDERYAMHVLTRMLGGGISSRLYRSVREERGWAYDISSDYVAYADAGLLSIEGSTPPQHLDSVLALVNDELSELACGAGIEEEDLVRAHAQIRSQVMVSGEDSHTRMSRLALQTFYFGRAVSDEEVVHGVEQVDAAAIASVALRCLAGGRYHALAVVGPDSLTDGDTASGRVEATFPPLDASPTVQ